MTLHILTLFPEVFESVFNKSIIKRALDKKILKIQILNIRNWGIGKHKQVDDKPYGGGKGMVMMYEPLAQTLKSIKSKPYTIILSPSGKKYSQKKATGLAKKKNIALICGHYEGIDARFEQLADEVISIGDYILTGGEIPAMIIIDSVTRLIPGVIQKGSLAEESFSELSTIDYRLSTLLEYPQYTRPENFRGQKVPPILLSGDHGKIKKWRQEQSLKRTHKFRPDLLKTR